ncbi:MAG: Rrf2 family transcriptional regulator [Bacteroidetes bacterium]|nr:Rrf2 family transcriptional regulator [Bacteroidota bacterium]
MLSKSCQHGIKAMICIKKNAQKSKPVSIGEVSSKINVPEAYTSKILQRLVKAGMHKSKKGVNGGFYIENRLLDKLTLWHIVNEIDGVNLKYGCVLGLDDCSNQHPCPVHNEYKSIRQNLITFFENTYLTDLTENMVKSLFDKAYVNK